MEEVSHLLPLCLEYFKYAVNNNVDTYDNDTAGMNTYIPNKILMNDMFNGDKVQSIIYNS